MGTGNIKKFELKLGKTGLIIVIGGMTLLLCLAFILGVGVGKNIDTYPERISSMPQQVLALFWRPAKVATEQNRTGQAAVPEKSNMDLTFHNALTSPKTPSLQQLPVTEKKTDNTPMTDQNIKPPMPSAALSPQEESVPPGEGTPEKKISAKDKSPVENKAKIKEIPASAQASAPLYIIHVASLKDKTKALQINKTIAALGYSSKVVKTDLPGKGTWYRVITSGFETKPEAQTAAEKIAKKVKAKCVIRAVSTGQDRNQ